MGVIAQPVRHILSIVTLMVIKEKLLCSLVYAF